MAEQFGLKYRQEIEELRELPDFEAQGDARYFHHTDPEARMTWAFYRPSGSHPSQIEDENAYVSIMAFNNSRLRPLERFGKLHPDVIHDPGLRVRVGKRARMLFRALADEDFKELVIAVRRYPMYTELACDQVANGRKMLEDVKADIFAASEFIGIAGDCITPKVMDAIMAKLPDVKEMESGELKTYLEFLGENRDRIHPRIKERFLADARYQIEGPLELHLLQKKAFQRLLERLS